MWGHGAVQPPTVEDLLPGGVIWWLASLGCSGTNTDPQIRLDALEQTWIRVEAPRALRAIELSDPHGAAIDEGWFLGQWTIVALGYTSCPDVCPLALTSVAAALDALAAEGLQARAAFVAVDPERDREHLAAYVQHFHPQITGMTGSDAQLRHAAEQLGGSFERIEGADGVRVEHSTTLFVVDPAGRVSGLHLRAARADRVAADVAHAMRAWAPPVAWRGGWIRTPTPGSGITAGYGTLLNHTERPLILRGVHSPAASAIHVHETVHQGSTAFMRPATIELPAGRSEVLAPGAGHLMISDLATERDRVRLLLRFDDETELWTELPVRRDAP